LGQLLVGGPGQPGRDGGSLGRRGLAGEVGLKKVLR